MKPYLDKMIIFKNHIHTKQSFGSWLDSICTHLRIYFLLMHYTRKDIQQLEFHLGPEDTYKEKKLHKQIHTKIKAWRSNYYLLKKMEKKKLKKIC